MSLRTQAEDIRESVREKSVRFRTTVNRILRFSEILSWKRLPRQVKSSWKDILTCEEFSVEEIRAAMRTEVMDGDIVPVAMGSNVQAQGVANLLSDIVRFFPSPDKRTCAGINRRTNEIFEANYDFSKAKTAYVFKTMVDRFYRKIFLCQGMLRSTQRGRCSL